jgi:hypothetical protein
MRKSKIDFHHKEIGDCTYSNDFKKNLVPYKFPTGRNNKSSSITEISVNDNSITDSKLIAESFNEYFVNIGPSLASKASKEPHTQHTTNSYDNSNPTTYTTFHFHRINVENIVRQINEP